MDGHTKAPVLVLAFWRKTGWPGGAGAENGE